MVGRRLLFILSVLLPLTGCARVGSIYTPVPAWTIRFIVKFGGPVWDGYDYFIAIDANKDDFGVAGPVPVAAGPWWGRLGHGADHALHPVQPGAV